MTQSIAHTWGTKPNEREQSYPCDKIIDSPDGAYFRGITVNAPVAVVYRWLCQMRVAPYSYDWIDNLGKQSPQHLIAGLKNPKVGQTFMTIFNLVEFEPDRQVTLQMKPGSRAERIFGEIAVTYQVDLISEDACRLVAKIIAKLPHTLWGGLVKFWLPWGDLLMMRKQLITFKKLSELENQ